MVSKLPFIYQKMVDLKLKWRIVGIYMIIIHQTNDGFGMRLKPFMVRNAWLRESLKRSKTGITRIVKESD